MSPTTIGHLSEGADSALQASSVETPGPDRASESVEASESFTAEEVQYTPVKQDALLQPILRYLYDHEQGREGLGVTTFVLFQALQLPPSPPVCGSTEPKNLNTLRWARATLRHFELVERVETGWRLTERGRALVEFTLGMPMPNRKAVRRQLALLELSVAAPDMWRTLQRAVNDNTERASETARAREVAA
ncbi:MAG: hypothetical protein ACLPJH_00250 [Myxococcaceae bacterium]